MQLSSARYTNHFSKANRQIDIMCKYSLDTSKVRKLPGCGNTDCDLPEMDVKVLYYIASPHQLQLLFIPTIPLGRGAH